MSTVGVHQAPAHGSLGECVSTTCPQCGNALRPVTQDALNQLVDEKLHRRIAEWSALRLVDPLTAQRLSTALAEGVTAHALPPPVAVPSLAVPLSLEQKADALAARLDALED